MGPQSAGLIITLGFGTGGTPPVPTRRGDTHDGFDDKATDKALRRRDEEFRQQRERLRSDLLQAVERVTGKPPPLDQSLKQLASIARKSEGFDYEAMRREIADIEAKELAASEKDSVIRAKAQAANIEQAQDEDEALIMLLITL